MTAPGAPQAASVVLVSNRGPFTMVTDDDGSIRARRGGGGFAPAAASALGDTPAVWVAAATNDTERHLARGSHHHIDGLAVRFVDPGPQDYDAYYGSISNEVLWFAHHHMFDRHTQPTFDRDRHGHWDAYRRVNAAFADAVVDIADQGAVVLVQDYHLTLVAALARHQRPDLRFVHFHHTPFVSPHAVGLLPRAWAHELLAGLGAHRACGFHSQRWADAFEASFRAVVGSEPPTTFIAPLGPDPDDLRAAADSDACRAAGAALAQRVGDRLVLARADRVEPSKNIVRGFLAFDELLTQRPEWRERVVFVARVYPSRSQLPAYRDLAAHIPTVVDDINRRWATPGWEPILYDQRDDFAATVALMRRADVLVVNPVADGLNLVATETPLVNQREVVVLCSREAGVHDQLDGVALDVEPHDLVQTADAMHAALAMAPSERAERASQIRDRARRHSPATWLAALIHAAG